ncbi:unnamed protein product [Gadus morhua 'NCC']
MDWFREREALKAQLLGLMKELEENRQVAQQLSFNVGPMPIETCQDRQGTDPPRRTAQPRRRIREVEMLDRIRQFQEREEREHLRNWLEVEKQRLDTDCMDWLFLERERQCFRFEHRGERYGIQRERVEQLRFRQDYRSGKRSYRRERTREVQNEWRSPKER